VNSDIELFLNHLDELMGCEGQYALITEKDERPPVWTVSYADVPEDGMLTAFTYGLSTTEHPDWKHGRPELVVSVNSDDRNWALAAGHVVRIYRGESSFSYGTVLEVGDRPSDQSAMSAFFLFAPLVLDQSQARVVLADRVINFVQAYPIYEREVALVRQLGPTDFFKSPGVDWFDIRRPALA
jgi:hypothetical protein